MFDNMKWTIFGKFMDIAPSWVVRKVIGDDPKEQAAARVAAVLGAAVPAPKKEGGPSKPMTDLDADDGFMNSHHLRSVRAIKTEKRQPPTKTEAIAAYRAWQGGDTKTLQDSFKLLQKLQSAGFKAGGMLRKVNRSIDKKLKSVRETIFERAREGAFANAVIMPTPRNLLGREKCFSRVMVPMAWRDIPETEVRWSAGVGATAAALGGRGGTANGGSSSSYLEGVGAMGAGFGHMAMDMKYQPDASVTTSNGSNNCHGGNSTATGGSATATGGSKGGDSSGASKGGGSSENRDCSRGCGSDAKTDESNRDATDRRASAASAVLSIYMRG